MLAGSICLSRKLSSMQKSPQTYGAYKEDGEEDIVEAAR